MRVSREQAAHNRKRVVDAAGQLFREKGFDGVGVAELMKAAGLTHGGFYGQFASKEALVTEALEEALKASVKRWKKRVSANPEAPHAALVEPYLSETHRRSAATGCPVAALCSDIARQGDELKRVYGDNVEALVEVLADTMPEMTPEGRRKRALLEFSTMTGALSLARAMGDSALADEIIETARAALVGTD